MLFKYLRKKRNSYHIKRHRARVCAAIASGLTLGKNVTIMDGVRFDPPHNGLIQIGDNTTIAPEVMFIAHDASAFKSIGLGRLGSIRIGNDCFIGARAILLPGVTIGNNVIIGSGSVVSKDIPDNKIAAGNPVRIIGDYDQFLVKEKARAEEGTIYGYVDFYGNIRTSLGSMSDHEKKRFYTGGQTAELRSKYRFNIEG